MLSSRWTRNTLDSYREIGDPQADSVIEKIFGLNEVDTVNKLLKDIQNNDDLVAVEMPDELEDFLNTTDDWPSWADREQIRLGQQLFSRYGIERADWTRHFLRPLRWILGVTDEIQDRSKLAARLSGTFSHRLIEGLHYLEREGQKTEFTEKRDGSPWL